MPPLTTTCPSTTCSPFKTSVLEGLRQFPKRLDCRYFYDARGSQLFDRICQLEEYYLARAEIAIMQHHARDMARCIGHRAMLVEYGSGSSVKTRLLLDELIDPVAYVPVDISCTHLLRTAGRLRFDYPRLEIKPVAADFTQPFELPGTREIPDSAVAYFPGSTIGNFLPRQAKALLASIAERMGPGGGLLIGIDLVKDACTLELAYNDPAGVTAEFNLNLLHRMRAELNAQLTLENFEHVANYNPEKQRVEIYIRSLHDQAIVLADETFYLATGELIHTEFSHKYTIEGFAKLASPAGFALREVWSDPQRYFAVAYFSVGEGDAAGHKSLAYRNTRFLAEQ